MLVLVNACALHAIRPGTAPSPTPRTARFEGWESVESCAPPNMARNGPERIKTKGGHSPRARIHAAWSPIGQKMRRTTVVRGLGAVLAVLLVIGLAADAYAQSFFDSLPPIQGLDSATFAGDTVITNSTGKTVLAR